MRRSIPRILLFLIALGALGLGSMLIESNPGVTLAIGWPFTR